MVRMAKSPTKIRVYGSKRITDRNIGVQYARNRGRVKIVAMKHPILLQAVCICIDNGCRAKGLT